MQKRYNPVGVLPVEFIEVASCFWQNFNAPRRVGASQLRRKLLRQVERSHIELAAEILGQFLPEPFRGFRLKGAVDCRSSPYFRTSRDNGTARVFPARRFANRLSAISTSSRSWRCSMIACLA